MPHRTYHRIYAVVERIPAGRVATYGQVAALAGLAGQARQVGYALHALSDGSPVPWQRVINARGEVSPRTESDAGGPGPEIYQRFLLEEEGVMFGAAGRVDLGRYRWDPDEEGGLRPRRRRKARRGPARREGMDRLVAEIEASLRPLGSPRRAAGEKAYLKSDLEFLGIGTPALRSAARAWLAARPAIDRTTLTRLAVALWRVEIHELRAFAIEVLLARQELLRAPDLARLEWMLRRSRSWAYVDAIAIRLVGPLVERTPRLAGRLDRWSADPDFWLRRSALLALLLPLRRGGGDWERFVGFADAMLEEREFFIRKAIGWVLREVSKKRPELVRAFVEPRRGRLSSVTLREAVKYLPARGRSSPPAGAASSRRRPGR
ncbi:MAG TPA: DNA alkylation repair protein [Thermoanaerobaculia bacterium]|nr:DNA alkylation repair protein [Thermoanaerobaculia bacterium]